MKWIGAGLADPHGGGALPVRSNSLFADGNGKSGRIVSRLFLIQEELPDRRSLHRQSRDQEHGVHQQLKLRDLKALHDALAQEGAQYDRAADDKTLHQGCPGQCAEKDRSQRRLKMVCPVRGPSARRRNSIEETSTCGGAGHTV
ncbi:MAG: hypothetical protein ACKVQA_19000 [Burkholderiales bacterium]